MVSSVNLEHDEQLRLSHVFTLLGSSTQQIFSFGMLPEKDELWDNQMNKQSFLFLYPTMQCISSNNFDCLL